MKSGGVAMTPVEQRKKLPRDIEEWKPPKVIVIGGPTCCGKTDLAIILAKTLGGEIITIDAVQVYRGMDIGTAKPTKEQLAACPHHMLDIYSLEEPGNVVDFHEKARHACDTIIAKGNVPIVVGGAGFYMHVFLYGPPDGPPADPAIRRALEGELQKYGVDALFERLQEMDPRYAQTITSRDQLKIVRALEIIAITKRPISSLPWVGRKVKLDYDFRCWFIHRSKESLYRRIDERCDAMLKAGLLAEVESLKEHGLCGNRTASQAIGYRQALKYLESPKTPSDFEEFVKLFKQASRNYAKRQFTWFKKERLFRWLDVDLHDLEVAADMIMNDYSQKR